MQLKIKKTLPQAIIPQYQTDGAACFDLHAATVDGYSVTGKNVWADTPIVCDTGLSFEVPEGWVLLIFSRSGHGFNHNVRLANATGVIDSDFRGPVKVKLTSDYSGNEEEEVPLTVKPGDRIAQAMLVKADQWELVEVEELSTTVRGEAGIGSTGQ